MVGLLAELHLTSFRAIHRILNLLTSDTFYNAYVRLPDANTPLASEIEDYIHSSKVAKDQLMELIWMPLFQMMQLHVTVIERVACHRMSLLPAHRICDLHIFSVVGRAVLLTGTFTKMLDKVT